MKGPVHFLSSILVCVASALLLTSCYTARGAVEGAERDVGVVTGGHHEARHHRAHYGNVHHKEHMGKYEHVSKHKEHMAPHKKSMMKKNSKSTTTTKTTNGNDETTTTTKSSY